MHNFILQKFEHLIDDIVIDLWLFGNFASIEDIKKKVIQ